MTQVGSDRTQDDAGILCKRRVLHRVQPHCDPRLSCCFSASLVQGFSGKFCNQNSMLKLAADGSTVFAIQRDIENTGAIRLGELSLQRQALAHARRHSTVVIAHRQWCRTCSTEQHITRVIHVATGPKSQQMGDASLFVKQLFERLVDALLTEGIDRQALDQLVLAAFTGDRKTE